MPSQLPTRKIGPVDVTGIGYGAMGISAFYGKTGTDEERFKFLDELYALGCTNWDTADMYGDNEDLLGKWFERTGKRSEIFLATKFGVVGKPGRPIDGSPEYVKEACDKSLKRLGVDYIDLYYLHRPDPNVPIEKTIGAMAELVKEGKVKYLGVSEITASSLRRGHAVHPISAFQVEYSPFCTEIEENGILDACRALGVAVVAYSPLGRGVLTGRYRSPDDFEPDDFRHSVPKYSRENFPKILKIADTLRAIGARRAGSVEVTASTVCLAWLLAQGDDVVPIPGTKSVKYLKENLAALDVKLTADEVREIRDVVREANLVDGRYGAGLMELCFLETPSL